MMNNYLVIQSFLALLCLNNVSGQNKPQQDEMDRSAIQQTGCKFLALAPGERVTYTLNSSALQHIALASHSPAAVTPDKFELRIAVRSDENLKIELTSRDRFNKNPGEPDYELEFGVNGNDFTISKVLHARRLRRGEDKWTSEQRYTPNILSADKYVKLYVILNERKYKLGQPCEHFPVYANMNYDTYSENIVQLSFTSHSQHGAKLLYDCPASYVDCKCTIDKH